MLKPLSSLRVSERSSGDSVNVHATGGPNGSMRFGSQYWNVCVWNSFREAAGPAPKTSTFESRDFPKLNAPRSYESRYSRMTSLPPLRSIWTRIDFSRRLSTDLNPSRPVVIVSGRARWRPRVSCSLTSSTWYGPPVGTPSASRGFPGTRPLYWIDLRYR